MPNGSWHYEFIAYPSTEAQQEWWQDEGRLFSRQECQQAAKFTRTFWWEIGWFCAAASEPSKDHQGRDIVSLPANHWRQKIFSGTLKAELLGSWPWRLQEQARGASVRAPSLWGTQSGRGQRLHQLDDVEFDGSNKAEAARQVKASSKLTSIPMLGMSFPRLPFLVGIAVLPRSLNFFCWEWEMGPRQKTRENNFFLSDVYIRCRKHAFNGCFEKQVRINNFANHLKCNRARNPSWFCSKIS
jgi:hypothetical protein